MGQAAPPIVPNPCDSDGVVGLPRLLLHLRDPTNLLAYLALSAWMKYMQLWSLLPSITVGG